MGNYTLTATVVGNGRTAPTGTVSFLDTSNGNAVLGTATLGAGTAGPNFWNSSNPAAGLSANAVAVGDFNGDGILDLAVADGSGDITVLLGNGDGTFTLAAASPATGTVPNSIATGDFNGDGILDLAVGSEGYGTVKVLLGNFGGDGTFTEIATVQSGPSNSIAVGDFNRDGILDMAVANGAGGGVTVMLGDGDGTFTVMVPSLGTGSDPNSIVVGDFNGDGIPDLAVVCNNQFYGPGTVTVLLGNGDGTFTAAASPGTGVYPSSMAVGDFNGDGILDLAVANLGEPTGDGTVTVLLGNGDGTFTATATSPATGEWPDSIEVGDFNGDGIPDLAVANEDSNTVTVLLGNGDGTFTAAPTSPATGINPISIAVGDFNGDGISDLAVANAGSEKATVLLAGRTAATATASGIALPVATGTHLVLASYSGDSNYGAGTSATTSLTATQGTPTVSVTASANPVAYGIAVTLKATVTGSGLTPTGTVTFYVGTTPLAKGTLSGGVYPYPTNTFAPGSYSITASYAGDSNYVAATSAALGLTVTQGTPTIVWPAPAPITYGTNLSAILDAAAQNGSGTNVPGTFAYTATSAGGTAVPVTAATILGIGSYTLGASFTPAYSNLYTSATGSVQLTVNPGAQIITFPNPGTQTYGAAPITLKATASSGLAVSYTVTAGPATVSGETLTITGAGSVTVRATQAGTSSYPAATPVSVTITVNKAALTATANSLSKLYGAANPTLTYAITGFVNGDRSAVVSGAASLTTAATAASAVGTYPIAFSTKSLTAANYSFTYASGTLTVYNTTSPMLLEMSSSGATAGGAGFTLTVTGANFEAKSAVLWNGAVRKTTYVSGTQLTAAIGAADIAKEKTNLVTVANPALNPGTSAALPFVVMSATPVAAISSGSIAVAAGSSGSHVLTLTGTDFVTSSAVGWNGSSLATTYVSPWQISAVITASNYNSLAANVTVKNAAGTSPGFELR